MRPQKNRGGTLKETTLWTNSNPSASFGEQSVTLSDSISNYDYIKIEWCESTNAQTNKSSIFASASEFIKYKNPNNNAHTVCPGIYARWASIMYARFIARTSDTQIFFQNAVRLNGSGLDNTSTIPLNIYGVKM